MTTDIHNKTNPSPLAFVFNKVSALLKNFNNVIYIFCQFQG